MSAVCNSPLSFTGLEGEFSFRLSVDDHLVNISQVCVRSKRMKGKREKYLKVY